MKFKESLHEKKTKYKTVSMSFINVEPATKSK